jgi:glycopeptide antibiotics resistance protein
MNYKEPILTAFLIFPILALLFTLPFILFQYHKYGSINKFRSLIIYSFILYLLTIYFLVILPLPSRETVANMAELTPNLIPFRFIPDMLKDSKIVLNNPKTYLNIFTDPAIYTVLYNILMTIPLGMYLRYYYRCSLKKVIVISASISIFFELTQLTGLYFIYPKAYRLFDVDDIILNTLGGTIGFSLMKFFKFLPSRERIDEKSLLVGMQVSGLRRFTLFLLDSFLYLFFTLLVYYFIRKTYIKYITFTIYYLIIPLFIGRTLGSSFLNVDVEAKYKTLKNFIRTIFLYFYYYYSFLIFLSLIIKIYNNRPAIGLMLLGALGVYVLFYPINIFKVLRKKNTFYDKIFKTKFISTIKINNEEETKVD